MQKTNFATLFQAAVLTLCLTASPVLANPIDVEQARNAVETFRKKPTRNGTRRAAAFNKGKLQHAYTKSTATGAPAVYVFNTGEGFVLASADDSTVPVLGYSDNGDFDPDNIPPALQYMMGEYAKQIAALPPRKANSVTPSYSVTYTTPVKPLIQTHWEQRNPYNILFPITGVGAAATGCVTTAMAQIMRYHKWPAKGYGSAEQDAKPYAAITHYEQNYYERNYQWDLMYNTTSEIKASQASINAVSQLMMDLAVGLFTDYTAGGTSNSNSTLIPPMLLSYFNYDPSIENIPLSSCSSQEEFNRIVINDLLAGRPVYFQGGPNSAAHAYVCDGYDGEGLFHINWGWGGTDDGYYLITNLTPSQGGTGGSGGVGYSQNLVMVHNIMPNQSGVLPRPELKAHYSSEIEPGYKLVKDGSSYYFYGNFNVYGSPDNKPRNFRGKLGLRVVDAKGQETIVWESKYTQIKANNHYNAFRIDLQSAWAAEGTRVYYICKEYEADTPRTIRDTRGDVCCIIFERNEEGELEATCNDVPVCTIEQGTVAPTNTVNVTYNIYLGGTMIGSTTVAEEVGKAPSMSFVPDYVSATCSVNTITESTTACRIDTEYKTGQLPFQSGKAYNILFQVNGNNYLWQRSGSVVNVKANPTSSDYANANAQWKFSGNWLDGFIIQNAGSGYYLTAPVQGEAGDRMLIANGLSYGDRQKCFLQHRNDGFYFKQKDCNLYLALTNVSSLNILLNNQKNFAGNLVTICEPSQLPAPVGVDYTVSISGNPENTTPQVLYQNEWYNNGGHINAVNLGVIDLYASPIDGYTPKISIGAKTIYVEYIANRPTGRNYTVNINAPTGQSAALYYNGQSYTDGSLLTAEGLSLMQLTATAIDGYEPDITIGSSSITVNYIPYENYTVNITGLTGTGLTASLLYAGQSILNNQTFSAVNLTAKELFATYIPNYSYLITIDDHNIVTVAYAGFEYDFATTTGSHGVRTTLKQSNVSVSYVYVSGKNNIYKDSYYTEVVSTELPIVKIEFRGTEGFDEVKANSGALSNGVWTNSEGVNSVRFTGGDAYSTGLKVYLKREDVPAQTPVAYTVNISGAPTGQNPVLYYKSKSYTHGKTFCAADLEGSQLSATAIGGYTYNINVGTGNVISVKYTPTGEPVPPTPTTITYSIVIENAPDGASVTLDGQNYTTSGTFEHNAAEELTEADLNATAPEGYTVNKSYNPETHTFTVNYTLIGTTYTIIISGATDGASVTLDGETFTTNGEHQHTTTNNITETSLTAEAPNGYYVETSYNAISHTFTVTFKRYYRYTVAVEGAEATQGGIIYDGKTYHGGETIQLKDEIYQTNVEAVELLNMTSTISFADNTFTVTYKSTAPIEPTTTAVELDFYREGVYSSERYTFQKESISVTCYNYNPGWEEYAAADISSASSATGRNMVISSEWNITKVEMYLCTTAGYSHGKLSNLSCSTGILTPADGSSTVWTGSAKEIVIENSGSSIYIGRIVVYVVEPTEEEKAMQEAREAIVAGTVGYPVLTEELRKAPEMAAYVAYYDNPANYTGSFEELQTSFNYFLDHCTEVNLPQNGHAYKLSVRSSDGTQHWFLDNEGGVTDQESQAAVFVVGGTGKGDFNTLFVSNDNTHPKYLRSNGATADQYATGSCDFKLSTMLKEAGTGISTSAASRLGTFCFRPQATGSLPMTLDTSDHSWKLSTSTCMDGTKSSAIELTEVEYPYTSPTLTADDERAKGAFASIYLPFPMQFPDGVEAYKGTQERSAGGKAYLALERVDTGHAVPAGGYILYSEEHTAGDPVQVEPAAVVLNDTRNTGDAVFIGSTEGPTKGDEAMWSEKLQGKNPYVLAKKNGIIGFYRYIGQTFPKGKAIWLAPDNESSETVRFGFEDIIETIRALHATDGSTEIYNLQGLRLDKPVKGQINIVNGKRVMIK